MSRFYTNVQCVGNFILYRGYENGRSVTDRIQYAPTLFVRSKVPTEYKTLDGQFLGAVPQGSIKEAREFTRQYKDVSNFTIYGNTNYEYAFIQEDFPDEVEWDISDIVVANLDIEVGSENGFPDIRTANQPVTAITLKILGVYHVFGTFKDYVVSEPDVVYHYCTDELDLLRQFMAIYTARYPDVLTGWNIKFFDIPYLVNRLTLLFGEKEALRLSPWGKINERTVVIFNKEQLAYIVLGVATLDYIELYRKFAREGQSRESYKLDYIAFVEGVGRKLSYAEYETLHKLYIENPQLFLDYNIRDVQVVNALDDKLKLIELAFNLAFDSKSNLEDVFTQTRMWDAIIYNYLMKKNIVIPPKTNNSKEEGFEGAYVKEPQIGRHKWVVSFDLNSLYPHLMMQFNLSPETLIDASEYTDEMRRFLAGNNPVNVENLLCESILTDRLQQWGVTVTPNRQLFDVTRQGFMGEIMQKMYDDRVIYKNKALAAKKKLEATSDPYERKQIEKDIARFDNMQLVKKVCLNSAYGAQGNEYFRFFDVRVAEAVTMSGQLAIRWIEKHINIYMNKICKTTNADYVIASDTDSVYIDLEVLIDKVFGDKQSDTTKVIDFMDKLCNEDLQKVIDDACNNLKEYTNAFAQKMFMKREALCDKGIWTGKKHYALNVWDLEGVRLAKPKVKVTGLELVKSSTPSFYREKMKEALEIIMNGTEADLVTFCDSVREASKTIEYQDISFPRSVSDLDEYADKTSIFRKGTPINARGCLLYNDALKRKNLTSKYEAIKGGSKIKYVYLKEPNPLMSDVISYTSSIPVELGLEKYIDRDKQYEKGFKKAILSITSLIDWQLEKVNTLDDFFV